MLGLYLVSLTVDISLEQFHGFSDEIKLVGDYPETAAMMDVEESEIERQQVEHPPVDEHHLAVITNQVFGRARDFHTALAQSALQLPDLFQIFFISVSDEGMDADAARGGRDQFMLYLQAVEAVEYDFYALFRLL